MDRVRDMHYYFPFVGDWGESSKRAEALGWGRIEEHRQHTFHG